MQEGLEVYHLWINLKLHIAALGPTTIIRHCTNILKSLIVIVVGWGKQSPTLIPGREHPSSPWNKRQLEGFANGVVRSLGDTVLQALQRKSRGLLGKWLRTGDLSYNHTHKHQPH